MNDTTPIFLTIQFGEPTSRTHHSLAVPLERVWFEFGGNREDFHFQIVGAGQNCWIKTNPDKMAIAVPNPSSLGDYIVTAETFYIESRPHRRAPIASADYIERLVKLWG